MDSRIFSIIKEVLPPWRWKRVRGHDNKRWNKRELFYFCAKMCLPFFFLFMEVLLENRWNVWMGLNLFFIFYFLNRAYVLICSWLRLSRSIKLLLVFPGNPFNFYIVKRVIFNMFSVSWRIEGSAIFRRPSLCNCFTENVRTVL